MPRLSSRHATPHHPTPPHHHNHTHSACMPRHFVQTLKANLNRAQTDYDLSHTAKLWHGHLRQA